MVPCLSSNKFPPGMGNANIVSAAPTLLSLHSFLLLADDDMVTVKVLLRTLEQTFPPGNKNSITEPVTYILFFLFGQSMLLFPSSLPFATHQKKSDSIFSVWRSTSHPTAAVEKTPFLLGSMHPGSECQRLRFLPFFFFKPRFISWLNLLLHLSFFVFPHYKLRGWTEWPLEKILFPF